MVSAGPAGGRVEESRRRGGEETSTADRALFPSAGTRRRLGTSTAAVALGANLGDRSGAIRAAVARIGGLGRVVAVSPLYETPAWPDPAGPAYLNGALVLATALEPEALLRVLLAIEDDLGRERSVPNAPRTIDLDLLLVDDLVRSTPDLVLPHPRMHERAFVLVPLAAVAPDWVHPLLRKTVADLLGGFDCGEVAAVRPIGDRGGAS